MLSETAEMSGTQQAFSKYDEHACVEEKFLRIIPRSQKVAQPYSPLVKKELFGPVHILALW
jgi:hypothetical protein